jgi:hypothetical protein
MVRTTVPQNWMRLIRGWRIGLVVEGRTHAARISEDLPGGGEKGKRQGKTETDHGIQPNPKPYPANCTEQRFPGKTIVR